MPQPYNNAVITDAGLSLLDKAQAGTASIQFTRMATGSGTYTADEKTPSALRKCTALKAEKNSYPLSSVSTVPDGGIKLTALITNQDPATGVTLVNEGYNINEIGLYAKEKAGDNSTEVLYSITVATYETGDYMPPYGGGAPVQIVQEYHAKVGNAAEVSISCTGAVMLAEDAQREFEDLKRMIDEGGAIGEKTLTFEEAKDRENIASGDRMDTILGKIKKLFADIRRVAFTGSYNDLVDTPELDPAALGAVKVALIPSGTDLNDIRTPGFYNSQNDSITATLKNVPTNTTFSLIVSQTVSISFGDWQGVSQRAISYTTGSPKIYFRNFYDGTWGAWQRGYTTVDKPTPADIGAVDKAGDTMTGYLKMDGAGVDIDVSNISGAFARGNMFIDKGGRIKGGVGVFGIAGVATHLYMSIGTESPWASDKGLMIGEDYIKWKNKDLATKGSVVNATLSESGWAGVGAPYTYTVTDPNVTTNSIINVDVASTVTSEQFDAFSNAKITDGGQAAGSFVLKAFGEKPGVDIPIKVEIR